MEELFDLHLFDGEGATGGDAGTDQAQGDAAQGETPAAEAAAEPTFDELVKGKYKQDYDKRVRDAVERRFRGQEQVLQRQKAAEPVLQALAQRYGVSPDDMDGLVKAVDSDAALYEHEASEAGVPVEQFMRMKQMERQNEMLKRSVEESKREQAANQMYAGWLADSERVKAVYPSFDLEAELGSDQFQKLLRARVDMKTAYEVVHKDEIVGGAMQFTAQKVAQKVASDVAARGMRPQESAAGAGSAQAVRRMHASELSREDVLKLAESAKRGIKTSF